MAGITTHILDISIGRPAANVAVELEFDRDGFQSLASGKTDDDGRVKDWSAEFIVNPGNYRLRFAVADYFAARGVAGFYPMVEIVFRVENPDEHFHVPLLLSPFGYSTYRGS